MLAILARTLRRHAALCRSLESVGSLLHQIVATIYRLALSVRERDRKVKAVPALASLVPVMVLDTSSEPGRWSLSNTVVEVVTAGGSPMVCRLLGVTVSVHVAVPSSGARLTLVWSGSPVDSASFDR